MTDVVNLKYPYEDPVLIKSTHISCRKNYFNADFDLYVFDEGYGLQGGISLLKYQADLVASYLHVMVPPTSDYELRLQCLYTRNAFEETFTCLDEIMGQYPHYVYPEGVDLEYLKLLIYDQVLADSFFRMGM